jgi:uncharacterized protein
LDGKPCGEKERSLTKRFDAIPGIEGWLHEPASSALGKGLVLTHGAGSDCQSPLLRAVAETFAAAGFYVLRCNLPYRQQRPKGPPVSALSAKDRDGIALAAKALRDFTPNYVIVGGHSYGGRQSSMLVAEVPEVADALLLLSYPLHPPRKPEQLRTGHFAQLRTPSLFIHGLRDPFGSVEEMDAALALIPSRHHLVSVEKVGHELSPSSAPAILRETQSFLEI